LKIGYVLFKPKIFVFFEKPFQNVKRQSQVKLSFFKDAVFSVNFWF